MYSTCCTGSDYACTVHSEQTQREGHATLAPLVCILCKNMRISVDRGRNHLNHFSFFNNRSYLIKVKIHKADSIFNFDILEIVAKS